MKITKTLDGLYLVHNSITNTQKWYYTKEEALTALNNIKTKNKKL